MSSSSAHAGNPPIAVIKTDPDGPPPEAPQPTNSSAHAGNPPIAVVETDPDAPPPEAPQPTNLADRDQEGRAVDVVDSYESILANLGYSDVLAPISEVTLDMASLPERVRSSPDALLGLRTQIYAMELLRRLQNFQGTSDSHLNSPILITGVTTLTTQEPPPLDEAEYSLETKVNLWLYTANASSVSTVPRTPSPSTVTSIEKQGGTDDGMDDHDEEVPSNAAALPLAPPSPQRQQSSSPQQDEPGLPMVDQTQANQEKPPMMTKGVAKIDDDGMADRDEEVPSNAAALPLAPPSSKGQESPSSLQDGHDLPMVDQTQANQEKIPAMTKKVADSADDGMADRAEAVPSNAAPLPMAPPSSQPQQSSSSQQDGHGLPMVDKKGANQQKIPAMTKKVADSADDGVADRDKAVPSGVAPLPMAPSSSKRKKSPSSQQDEPGLPMMDKKRAKKKGIAETSFKCSVCNRAFNRKGDLNRHLSMGHNIKPYKCEHCPKRCQSWKSLCNHMKRRHNILPTGAKMGRPASTNANKGSAPVPPGNPAPIRHLRILLHRCDEEELAARRFPV